jgi:hypothetical protein
VIPGAPGSPAQAGVASVGKGVGSGLAVAAQVVQVFFRHVQSPEK